MSIHKLPTADSSDAASRVATLERELAQSKLRTRRWIVLLLVTLVAGGVAIGMAAGRRRADGVARGGDAVAVAAPDAGRLAAAETAAKAARSRELAYRSETQIAIDPEVAI